MQTPKHRSNVDEPCQTLTIHPRPDNPKSPISAGNADCHRERTRGPSCTQYASVHGADLYANPKGAISCRFAAPTSGNHRRYRQRYVPKVRRCAARPGADQEQRLPAFLSAARGRSCDIFLIVGELPVRSDQLVIIKALPAHWTESSGCVHDEGPRVGARQGRGHHVMGSPQPNRGCVISLHRERYEEPWRPSGGEM